MSHFFTIVIMPADTKEPEEIEAKVAELLAPFDERLEVEGRRNPQSKWDWYEIGGGWNGAIRDKYRDEYGVCSLQENMLPASIIDHKLTAHAIVTPDGKWHEQGRMGWFALVANEKDDDVWDQEIVRLIQKHRDCILVGVDCHI